MTAYLFHPPKMHCCCHITIHLVLKQSYQVSPVQYILVYFCKTHSTSGAQPLSIGYFRQWGVEAVYVIRGRAGVTAKQLSSIFTHSAELHVIILLFLSSWSWLHHPSIITLFLKLLKFFFFCLPLYPFFLLAVSTSQNYSLIFSIKLKQKPLGSYKTERFISDE